MAHLKRYIQLKVTFLYITKNCLNETSQNVRQNICVKLSESDRVFKQILTARSRVKVYEEITQTSEVRNITLDKVVFRLEWTK